MGMFGQKRGEVYSMSTPFLKIGKGNLSLPYVERRLRGVGGTIKFGKDNLYSQLIDQMYYTSPLHGAIIDYKVSATIGGGYTLRPRTNDQDTRIDMYVFEKRLGLDNMVEEACQAAYMHKRFYRIIEFEEQDGRLVPVGVKEVSPAGKGV